MRAMRHLMSGGIFITIYRDQFHTEALQRDDDFFAKLTAAQQHDFSGAWAERSAESKRFHSVQMSDFE